MRAPAVRAANAELVLRHLRSGAGSAKTRAELSLLTSLTPQAIGSILAELVDRGLVLEQPSSRVGPGRPPTEFRLDPEGRFCVVVILRFGDVHLIVEDALERVVAFRRFRQKAPTRPRPLVDRVVRVMTRLLESVDIPLDRVGRVEVTVEGRVDEDRLVVHESPLWSSTGLGLGGLFVEALPGGIELSLTSADRALAATAYHELGADPSELVVIVHIGHSIRLYLASDGVLLASRAGNTGSLHHFAVAGNDRRCPCGEIGCLGTVASGEAVITTYRDRTGIGLDAAADLIDRVGAGDLDAIEAAREAVDWLGRGLAPLLRVLDPDRVVLTGAVGGGDSPGSRQLIATVRRHLHPSQQSVPIHVVQPYFAEQTMANLVLR